MARQLTQGELDRMAVDFPVSGSSEPYQTTSDRFKNVQAERLTDPTRAKAEKERQDRIKQKQAELEEFMAAAAYQDNIATQRAQELAAAYQAASAAQSEAATAKGADLLDAAKNTPAALWMIAWHTWFWLTFQLPLAFISLTFIGLQAAMEGTWIGRLFQGIMGVINAAVSIFGGDLSFLTPINIALAVHFLVFGLCILCLLGTLMLYAVRGQNPLGGDRAAGKFGALLLCFIGYSTPLLNLFPWIGTYIYVMWRSKS